MSDIAIRVENLSKLYHIGMLQQRHDTTSTGLSAGLRDALTARFRGNPKSKIRRVVGVFRDLGSRHIERLGTGVRRMAAEMETHGLPRPRFEEMSSDFRVTLVGPGERFMAEMEVRPAWAKGLHERQVEAVLYVGEHGRMSRGEYAELLGVSLRTAARDLSDLATGGILALRGAGRGAHYVLGPWSV